MKNKPISNQSKWTMIRLLLSFSISAAAIYINYGCNRRFLAMGCYLVAAVLQAGNLGAAVRMYKKDAERHIEIVTHIIFHTIYLLDLLLHFL